MKHIAVVGGGAAGVFAAINIKEKHPDYQVTVFEKSDKLLQKVKISGGGRCNVTHYCFDMRELAKHYPRGGKELLSVFSRFQPADTIAWFDEKGVTLKVEDDGRMFPDTDTSQTIIDCFVEQLNKQRVQIKFRSNVTEIVPLTNTAFQVEVNNNKLTFDAVVVACGGLNKRDKFSFLKSTDHSIEEPVPSLFTFKIDDKLLHQLKGVSISNAFVKLPEVKQSFEGPLLITHWGFSGPGIIKLSALAARELHKLNYTTTIVVNWINVDFDTVREKIMRLKTEQPKRLIKNVYTEFLPKKLWFYLLNKSAVSLDKELGQLSKKEISALTNVLTNDTFEMNGKTTFKEEFVTCGGIKRKEIDFKTMESRFHKGLFFAGEVIDIDGLTGGFNFQAAWSTAWLVSESV